MEDEEIEKKEYAKKPLSLKQQVLKLKSRGLIVDDVNLAESYLSNISYYRLRAYTFPFQNNTEKGADHKFINKNIHFKDIIDIYCFDRRLRSLVFNALEKIEVAIRTKIVQIYSESTDDSHWYENEKLFNDDECTVRRKNEETGIVEIIKEFKYNILEEDILREVDRSNEDFIEHYSKTYHTPENPPAWMTLEVISFGTLSRLYELLIKDDNKKEIAKQFGLQKIDIMENWLHALSILRNCCAHHSRIWNRRFPVQILLPYNTTSPFIDRATIPTIKQNKLFAYLCCVKYILDIISPHNDFQKNLLSLLDNAGRLLVLKDMGFPDNWKYFGVWK